jgi:AcrR family transcriptional regulator
LPRPKQRTPELRDRVVRTAVALLAADGVAGFTTRRVAESAETSIPAVYELFGDRAGLVREVYLAGFRQLRTRLEALALTADVRTDLTVAVVSLRAFVRDNPALADVMFTRPFADYSPGADEMRATAPVRELFVGRVRRCIDVGVLVGNQNDIAHVLLALALGLAAQETAGWLGSSTASRDRRWAVAFQATLAGFAPDGAPASRGINPFRS